MGDETADREHRRDAPSHHMQWNNIEMNWHQHHGNCGHRHCYESHDWHGKKIAQYGVMHGAVEVKRGIRHGGDAADEARNRDSAQVTTNICEMHRGSLWANGCAPLLPLRNRNETCDR